MGARIGDFVEIEPDQLAFLDDLPDGVDRMQPREYAHGAAPIFPLRELVVHADNLLPDMEAHRLASPRLRIGRGSRAVRRRIARSEERRVGKEDRAGRWGSRSQ